MIWVPKFSLSINTEDTRIKESKRRLESETTVKKSKKPKAEVKEEENKDPNDESNTLAEIDIPEAQFKRAESMLVKLEALLLMFISTNVECQDADGEVMPKKFKEKPILVLQTFEGDIKALKGKIESEKAVKGGMRQLFDKIKDSTAKAKEAFNKAKLIIDGVTE